MSGMLFVYSVSRYLSNDIYLEVSTYTRFVGLYEARPTKRYFPTTVLWDDDSIFMLLLCLNIRSALLRI